MENQLKSEANHIRYLLDQHSNIDINVRYYLQLLNDLLHDCEIVYRKDADLFYVVDFSILFDKIFPAFAGRGRAKATEKFLIRRLRNSIAEKALINFLFSICPKKVLLKVYAEEYKNFFAFHQNWLLRLPLEGETGKTELLDYMAKEYCYFALWSLRFSKPPQSAEVQKNLRDEMNQAIEYFSNILEEAPALFSDLVDRDSPRRLLPLSEVLEGQQLESISTSDFEQLSKQKDIERRRTSSIQNDINALSVVKALNEQFGREAEPEKTSSDNKPVAIQYKIKRFVFVTRDSAVLRAIRSLPLNVCLPESINSEAEEPSFCRSLGHILLLYMCCQEVREGKKIPLSQELNSEELKDLIKKLKDSRNEVKDYLEAINEAEDWLKDKDRDLENPNIRATMWCRWLDEPKHKPVNPEDLQRRIESFRQSTEFQNILQFEERSLLAPAVISKIESTVPQVTNMETFIRATEELKTLVPRLEYKEGSPFEQLERIRRRLDVIIALFDTPVWNRYKGFNYESPDPPDDHPLKEELIKVASLLRDREPAKNAEALELLYYVIDKEELKSDNIKKRYSILTDPFYNALLSKVYRIQGRYDESIRICNRAEFMRSGNNLPDHSELIFEKGLSKKFLEHKHYKEEAKKLFEKAHRMCPTDGRFVHELAVAVWRVPYEEIENLREKAQKEWRSQLFYSHPDIIDIVQRNKSRIEHALKLVNDWQAAQPKSLEEFKESNDSEKPLFVHINNARAYWKWILALKSKKELEKDTGLMDSTQKKFQIALEIAEEAYRVFEEIDKINRKRAQNVRLHVLETLIQIRLSLCEIAALKRKPDTTFLNKLDKNLKAFRCTPEFEACYHCIHEEYDKFREIYKIYKLILESKEVTTK